MTMMIYEESDSSDNRYALVMMIKYDSLVFTLISNLEDKLWRY